MKNNELAQITKAYTKRSKLLNKNFTKDLDAGLLLFVEHLRYLRDSLILKANVKNMEPDSMVSTKMTSLIVAVAEFEAFQNNEDIDKQNFHWNNFCELIKLNMGEWLTTNDTV